MNITIRKSQFNLVTALQLCVDVYVVDKKRHSRHHKVVECFGQEIDTGIHREMLSGSNDQQ